MYLSRLPRSAPEEERSPTPRPSAAPATAGALSDMLHGADAATAARTLMAVQRESGNAAATALARGVLARQPAPPTAEPATQDVPAAEPDAPETGIGDAESLARYVTQARTIMDNWDDYKTPFGRLHAMRDAINAELIVTGTYPLRAMNLVEELATEGHFEAKSWTAVIHARHFTGPKPRGGYAERAAVVAHEARHCEQAYLAARLLAGSGRSPAVIAEKLGIPDEVANAAHRRPIGPDDPEAAEAEVFLSTMVGAGAREHRRVMKRLDAAKEAYDKALGAYERAAPADKPALQPALDAAEAEHDEAYAAYRALATEVDAFEHSADVERAFRETPRGGVGHGG